MGTIDLDAGPDCWAPSERKTGELLGQLERGKGNRHTVRASNAGHPSEYAQALSEANAKRLLAAAEEMVYCMEKSGDARLEALSLGFTWPTRVVSGWDQTVATFDQSIIRDLWKLNFYGQ